MGSAIGSILGLAAGVAVSPLPIVAIILMLATPGGRRAGIAFTTGWIVGLGALGAIVLAIAGPTDSTQQGTSSWVGWLKVVLGVLLLAFAIRQWRHRPAEGQPVHTPKWMAGLDTITAPKATGMGALLATVNPKNGTLTIAAAASISGSGVSVGGQAVALAVFVVIGSLGVIAPLAVYLLAGQKAAHVLETWRTWFVANNTAIMAVLFFVLGLKLVGDAIGTLA